MSRREIVDRAEVLLDVVLRDPLEVVVPGAPGGRRWPQGPDARPPRRSRRPTGPARSSRSAPARHGGRDLAVGTAPRRCRPTTSARIDGIGPAGRRRSEDVHAVAGAGVDGEQALPPERVGRGRPLGSVVADPAEVADRTERPLVEAVDRRRAPRLPAVLVDAGALGVHGHGGDDVRHRAGTVPRRPAGRTRHCRRQPLTAPAVIPRTKYRCRDRNTRIGTIIMNRPPAVSSCQPCPCCPSSGPGRWTAARCCWAR